MRTIGFVIVLWSTVLLTITSAPAWQGGDADRDPDPEQAQRLLAVELTRFVIADADVEVATQLADAEDLAGAIRRLERAGQVKVHERIGLTALEDEKCMAQFGRRVSVVVGEMIVQGARRTQQTQFVELGTMLQVTARMDGEHVVMQLIYEASRHEPDDAQPGPPTVATTSVSTSLKMKLGESVLVNSNQAEDHSLLVVSVRPRSASRVAAARRGGRPRAADVARDPAVRERTGRGPTDRFADYARRLIGRYDRNEDGALDREEASESNSLGRRFDAYDRNSDGKVTEQEVVDQILAGRREE